MAKTIPLPAAAELVENEPRLIVHDGVPYCAVKVDGTLRVYVAACSHKARALVPLRLKKGALVCPHHGARFDVATGEVSDARGVDVPTGLPSVPTSAAVDGTLVMRARKRHRRWLSKKERKRVAKAARATS